MSEYSSDYGREYDFTDYPPNRECIDCTEWQNEEDSPPPQKCPECGEWLCAPCIEKSGRVCATCREAMEPDRECSPEVYAADE